MGYGYQWSTSLNLSAYVALAMSGLLLLMLTSIYLKRRRLRVDSLTIVSSVLVTLLLVGAVSALYQSTFSTKRQLLDSIDFQLITVVDLERRARYAIYALENSADVDDALVENTLRTAQGDLKQLEHTLIRIEGIDQARALFNVEGEFLSIAESLGSYVGGRGAGLWLFVMVVLIAVTYTTIALCIDKDAAMLTGFLVSVIASVIFVALGATNEQGDITPLILLLVIPGIVMLYLHYCVKLGSTKFLEKSASIILVAGVFMLGMSCRLMVLEGKNEIGMVFTAVKKGQGDIPRHAARLRQVLADLEAQPRETGWASHLRGESYGLYYAVGGLEESIGNTDPQSDDPAELHYFDPLADAFAVYEKRLDSDFPRP